VGADGDPAEKKVKAEADGDPAEKKVKVEAGGNDV
jgi:hypothetical protein